MSSFLWFDVSRHQLLLFDNMTYPLVWLHNLQLCYVFVLKAARGVGRYLCLSAGTPSLYRSFCAHDGSKVEQQVKCVLFVDCLMFFFLKKRGKNLPSWVKWAIDLWLFSFFLSNLIDHMGKSDLAERLRNWVYQRFSLIWGPHMEEGWLTS